MDILLICPGRRPSRRARRAEEPNLRTGGLEEGPRPGVFPGTVDLLRRLRTGHIPAVLASSSRNARAILERARLLDEFDLIVDGQAAADLHLPGKPDPALFLEAAREIGFPAARVAVIEDAVAGVKAARAGGVGLVVGIDRDGQRAELEAAGADVVLNDVSEFDIGLVLANPWHLTYEGMRPRP